MTPEERQEAGPKLIERGFRQMKTFLGTEPTAAREVERIRVIREAIEMLSEQKVVANQFAIKWIVPFHGEAVNEILSSAKRVLIVENNHSGQFARYLRSETGFSAHGHIRKYDGEPFMPHHIVEGVLDLLNSEATTYVPHQEMIV